MIVRIILSLLIGSAWAGVWAQSGRSSVQLVVLGNVQDAGSPHIGCRKDCCKKLFENPDPGRKVVALGVVDKKNNQKFLFEATPDISTQTKMLKSYLPENGKEMPDGIFLTHAHIGHYAGLMYLGKEAIDAAQVPVFAMPKMDSFLRSNGPWSQLIARNNIVLTSIENGISIKVNSDITVMALKVPHRDEYSETVGFVISGPKKKALFIPDIDKWEKWERAIIDEINKVDYAFIDATFFSGAEINNRDISQIPHPFVIESMKKFESLPAKEKSKVYFIHLNHTNPALLKNSPESKEIERKGFHVARFKDQFDL